jgi:hypothetical protein
MVLGLVYKRFLTGAKGWEQVPLIGWYREFGNLEAVSHYSASIENVVMFFVGCICRMDVT